MYQAWEKQPSRRKKVAVAAATAAFLIGGTAVATALPGNKVGILVADNPELEGGVRLSGKTLQAVQEGGAVYYVYLESNTGNIEQVRFFLDDETGSKAPTSVDTTSPYILDNSRATSTTGRATTTAGTSSRSTTAPTSSTRTASTSSDDEAETPKAKSKASSDEESSEEADGNETHDDGETHLRSANAEEGHEDGEDHEEGADEESTSDDKPARTTATTGSRSTTGSVSTAGTRSTGTGARTTATDAGETATAPTATSPRTTTSAGAVAGFDTANLVDGEHSLLVEITAKGGVFDLFATFTIDNTSATAGSAATPVRGKTVGGKTPSGGAPTDTDEETTEEESTDEEVATAPAGNRAPSSNECAEHANGDLKETCQGPNDGEAGEIQAYVAELKALFKTEQGMKDAGLFLDPGSHNHYQVYASKWKREWPSGARVAHLIADDGGIRGAQIDTSGGNNPEWLRQVPNSGGDGGHTHMDGNGGYWHAPH